LVPNKKLHRYRFASSDKCFFEYPEARASNSFSDISIYNAFDIPFLPSSRSIINHTETPAKGIFKQMGKKYLKRKAKKRSFSLSVRKLFL